MKRKGPPGKKPAKLNAAPLIAIELDAVYELKLAERIAMIILAKLRAEVPQLFTAPGTAPAPVEGARA